MEYFYARHGVVIGSSAPDANDPDFNAGNGSLNPDHAPAANVLLRVERRYLRGQAPVLQRPNDPTANSYGNLTSSLVISF